MSEPLPPYETPILGRQRETESLLALLKPAGQGACLVTLTGPGGVGKSRLAVHAASLWSQAAHRRVVYVPLASLDDPGRLSTALAIALDLQETGSMPLATNLADALRDRRDLIVLDSFEHMRGGEALIGDLLVAAPGIQFLVTSRAPTHLPGEVEFAVPPLAVPDPLKLPSAYVLSNYPAVALFVQRAQAAAPDFSLGQANAAAVAEICVRLDGLPLAIELAAARIAAIPPETMRERLEARLMLLIGSRERAARHQTLRAAIDWSFDLLSPLQQLLFARLSVFAGSADLEAIRGVCDPHGELAALDADLTALVEQSLVILTEARPKRYALLETMQEYGRERLAERGETETLHHAHAQYFAALAEGSEADLRGSDQIRWLARWNQEINNVRAALAWSVDSDEPELGLRLAAALQWFWFVRGHIKEGRRWLERLLEQLPKAPSTVRGRALNALARLAVQQDLNAAQRHAEEALDIWGLLNNPLGLADACYSLGRTTANRGDDPAGAARYYERSLQLYLEREHAPGVADVWFAQGLQAANQGNSDEALSQYGRSLSLRRDCGDIWGIARTLTSLAFITADRLDFESARRYGEESLALYRDLGDTVSAAALTLNQAFIDYLLGRYARARDGAQEALRIWNEAGRRLRTVSAYHQLAQIDLAEGRCENARRLADDGRAISERAGFSRGLGWMGLIYAESAYLSGDDEAALANLAELLDLLEKLNDITFTAAALRLQSLSLLRTGQTAGAQAAALRGLHLLEPSADKVGKVALMEALACICAAAAKPAAAARLWAACEAERSRLQTPCPPSHQAIYRLARDQARSAGAAEFDQGWTAGTDLTLESAISLSLSLSV